MDRLASISEATPAKIEAEKDDKARERVTEMIPPADTIFRIMNYAQANFEPLIGAVYDIYNRTTPIFDVAINPYAWHDDEKKARQFVEKHKGEVLTSIYIAHSGKWNMFSPYRQVRDNTDFYTDNTRLLKEMALQIEADAKLGQELMRKRVKKTKKKNIAEAGPDAPGFAKWKKSSGALKSLGVEEVPQDESLLEVDVFTIAKGGKEMKKETQYIEAEPPDEKEAERIRSGAREAPKGGASAKPAASKHRKGKK
jgi:hypothetical protein